MGLAFVLEHADATTNGNALFLFQARSSGLPAKGFAHWAIESTQSGVFF